MKFEVKHRYSGAVLFSLECGSLKLCVEAAVKSDSNLGGANLRGADLRDAYLGGAYLGGADLGGANLRGANLRDAYLRDANLRGADLRDAYLGGAYLGGANLVDAYLGGANLRGANFDIEPANAEQSIANLDKVRAILIEDEKRLHMDHWHGDEEWIKRTCAEEAVCGTTHCLAGWLQVCSTDERLKKLEPSLAGFLAAPQAARLFHSTDSEVLKWLDNREYAKEAA